MAIHILIKLEIKRDSCNGNIRDIAGKSKRFDYLSTHTFYGGNVKTYDKSTKRLQECGFNICLENWDGENIYSKPSDKLVELFDSCDSLSISRFKDAIENIIKIKEERQKIAMEKIYKKGYFELSSFGDNSRQKFKKFCK